MQLASYLRELPKIFKTYFKNIFGGKTHDKALY